MIEKAIDLISSILGLVTAIIALITIRSNKS